MSERCWCGNHNLLPFGAGYLRCPECETLVAVRLPAPAGLADAVEFYGRDYWFNHQQQDLNLPDLEQRARRDLPERDLFWLRTLLRYKLPPADVLEVGCSHGGFVAVLRWAGYTATGLELNPWVTDFARQTFDIPVLEGALETQTIPPHSLDGVVLMDVLEHLPDPRATLSAALNLLRPQGLILLQTPCYPAGMSYETLVEQHSDFLKMLLPAEHLYLFSQAGVQRLFVALGAPTVRFEPAFFPQHDMYLAASCKPLEEHTPEQIQKALAHPGRRAALALLDLEGQFRALQQQLEVVEADRAARLELLEGQGQELARLRTLLRNPAAQARWQMQRAARRIGRAFSAGEKKP